jgi:hypothetical protein
MKNNTLEKVIITIAFVGMLYFISKCANEFKPKYTEPEVEQPQQ